MGEKLRLLGAMPEGEVLWREDGDSVTLTLNGLAGLGEAWHGDALGATGLRGARAGGGFEGPRNAAAHGTFLNGLKSGSDLATARAVRCRRVGSAFSSRWRIVLKCELVLDGHHRHAGRLLLGHAQGQNLGQLAAAYHETAPAIRCKTDRVEDGALRFRHLGMQAVSDGGEVGVTVRPDRDPNERKEPV